MTAIAAQLAAKGLTKSETNPDLYVRYHTALGVQKASMGSAPAADRTGLLQRGERRIVLAPSSVSRIDAAGVGELVRAYNFACDMNVSLRIVHTTERGGETLGRVGLFDL